MPRHESEQSPPSPIGDLTNKFQILFQDRHLLPVTTEEPDELSGVAVNVDGTVSLKWPTYPDTVVDPEDLA